MVRRLRKPALLAIVVLTLATAAQGEVFRNGDLQISLHGRFSPHSLPRDRPAPVTVSFQGKIETTDGSHPPPLRRIEFALNRNGRLSTRGLPTCASPQLQSTTTQGALARCRPALVGRGHFGASVDFPNLNFPAQGTVLAFNGRRHGRPALLLQLYGTTPVRATFVLPLAISHPAEGRYGTVLSADLPTLAGGLGSVTELDLKVGRTYSDEGRRRSFISAACAAPAGFPGAVFSFARGTFYFADERVLRPTLVGNCRVR